jgi:hypothetical protein
LFQPRQLRRMTPFGEHHTGMERTDDMAPFANFLPTIESVGISAAAIWLVSHRFEFLASRKPLVLSCAKASRI